MKKKLAVFSLEKKRDLYGDDHYVLGTLQSILPIIPGIDDTIEQMNIADGEMIVVLPIYTKD